jgi:mono/diheme cytochrome c family protein
MTALRKWVTTATLAGSGTLVCAQGVPGNTRGELPYSTHCVTCHTTQVHWRDDKKAYDWDSLTFQVRRWQRNAGQTWNEADISEVSRYLNDTIYRYSQVNERVGLVSGGNVPLIPRK